MNYLQNVCQSLSIGAKAPFQYFGGRAVEAFAGPIDKRVCRLYRFYLINLVIAQHRWVSENSRTVQEVKVKQFLKRIEKTLGEIVEGGILAEVKHGMLADDKAQDVLKVAEAFVWATQRELTIFHLMDSSPSLTLEEASAMYAVLDEIRRLALESALRKLEPSSAPSDIMEENVVTFELTPINTDHAHPSLRLLNAFKEAIHVVICHYTGWVEKMKNFPNLNDAFYLEEERGLWRSLLLRKEYFMAALFGFTAQESCAGTALLRVGCIVVAFCAFSLLKGLSTWVFLIGAAFFLCYLHNRFLKLRCIVVNP